MAPPPEGEGCAQLPTTPFGRGPWNLGTLEGLGGVNNRAKQQANCACPTAISSHNQQAPSRQTVAPSSSTNALEPTGPASATSTFAPCALQPPRFSPLTRHAYDCACDPSPVQDRLHPNPSSPKTSTPSHNFRIPPTTALIIITLPSTATRQHPPQNKTQSYRVQGSKSPNQRCPPAPNDQQKNKHNHNGRWKGQVLGRQELWWEDVGHRRAQEAAEPLCPCWSPGKNIYMPSAFCITSSSPSSTSSIPSHAIRLVRRLPILHAMPRLDPSRPTRPLSALELIQHRLCTANKNKSEIPSRRSNISSAHTRRAHTALCTHR